MFEIRMNIGATRAAAGALGALTDGLNAAATTAAESITAPGFATESFANNVVIAARRDIARVRNQITNLSGNLAGVADLAEQQEAEAAVKAGRIGGPGGGGGGGGW